MQNNKSLIGGLFFGLTSGTITTIGLMVGLVASTNSKVAVIGGLVTIAVSDSLSDAFGMHLSMESNSKNSIKNVWQATLATFLSKFIFAFSFVLPVVFLEIRYAIIINVLWGFLLLALGSRWIAKNQKESVSKAVLEHLLFASLVLIISYSVGFIVGGFMTEIQ